MHHKRCVIGLKLINNYERMNGMGTSIQEGGNQEGSDPHGCQCDTAINAEKSESLNGAAVWVVHHVFM